MPLTLGSTKQSVQEAATDAPRQRSAQLLQGSRRLLIDHHGETYCLRLTRNERLILTKV